MQQKIALNMADWVRRHDRSHFFKYASCRTALRVIQSKQFRWSSPVHFNDPFDHQSGFTFTFDRDELARQLVASAERMIFTDTPPQVGASEAFTALLILLRTMRDRLERKKVLAKLRGSGVLLNFQDSLGIFNDQLHAILCNSRVFCVSEVHDNVVMWSHYGDEHRGVVFKLRCDDEVDNILRVARKVEYSKDFVALPDPETYAKHLTGEVAFDMPAHCYEIAYRKHLDWSYEKEWRVHVPLRKEQAGDGYSLFDEKPQAFGAIYLGCRMPPEDVEAISAAAQTHLPNAAIFQGRRSHSAFELEFERIEMVTRAFPC